jgi:hypothetical protein
VIFVQGWANATVDVLKQSLENFGFDALYHSTGPPYSISLDVQGELSNTLDMALSGDFATDVEFQEHLQDIFAATLDAHTRYQKPACYNAIFVQPFAFDMRIDNTTGMSNEPSVYLMRNLYTDTYADLYAMDLDGYDGKEVKLLDGLEFTSAVSAWGDTHETRSNNRGVRFNAAIRSYMYRSAMSYSVLPMSDLSLTFRDGSSLTLPWMVSYTNGLADVSKCAALPEETAAVATSSSTMHKDKHTSKSSLRGLSTGGSISFHHDEEEYPHLLSAPTPLSSKVLLEETRTDREVILPPDSAYYVSCFIQTVTGENASLADVSRVLVMKVASFSPPGEWEEAWSGFLNDTQTCLSANFDMIVVDVMQNGGGYVCLGLRLVELLVEEYEDDHTKVQMIYDLPHSPLMDLYIDVVNAPNPYPDPGDVEQILNRETQEQFVDGRAYYYPGRNLTQGGVTSWRTNPFSLDCSVAEGMPANNWRPPKFMPVEKLIILTDGTCGSTCASFTKIPQEAGKATFVGAGGLWDEGMDVSSFAGGFVCNPDYLQNIANWSGTTFPKFETNQRWQFGWATWYSAKLPSRPVQFTVQDPNYREAFW